MVIKQFVSHIQLKSAIKDNYVRLASFILDMGHSFSENYWIPAAIYFNGSSPGSLPPTPHGPKVSKNVLLFKIWNGI